MITIPGYILGKELYFNSNISVYRGRDVKRNQDVIIKYLRKEYPDLKTIKKFQKEYQLIQNLKIKGIVKPVEFREVGQSVAIIFEDFGGESLDSILVQNISQNKFFSMEDFLKIAIQITRIIYDIHANRIIHKDIKPSNIMLNLQTGEIKITDFGIASYEIDLQKKQDYLEGSLAYISPEQTGKTNMRIDYRSDIYSLGITLYELCTNQLPFTFTDANELVHAHIAKIPVSPTELNPKIPPILRKIILKCLQKAPEDRYQNADGLLYDLSLVQTGLSLKKPIQFELGQKDIPIRFKISQKLYGVQDDISRIYDQIQVTQKGLFLFTGPMGIGKSAFIQEIVKQIPKHAGMVVLAKFDQFRSHIAYDAFIQIMNDLIQYLTGIDSQKRSAIIAKLKENLALSGKILIHLVPELESLIGQKPDQEELNPKESENRMQDAIGHFLNAFIQKDIPLIIILDNLQWADPLSIHLIEFLLVHSSLSRLLILGAYRGCDISQELSFSQFIQHLRESDLIHVLPINPMSRQAIADLLVDTFYLPVTEIESLAKMIEPLSKGNPYYILQLLEKLCHEGYLYFDFFLKQWRWDAKQIHQLDIPGDVVDLLIPRIQKMNPKTKELLKIASCIGQEFSADIITKVSLKSEKEVLEILKPAFMNQVIIEIEGKYHFYQFIHDKVHAAIFELISSKDKPMLHWKIGKALLSLVLEEKREEQLMTIMGHLNQGLVPSKAGILIPDSDITRAQLVHYNLMAGTKAKISGAYPVALGFFQTGIDLLPQDRWKTNYSITKQFYMALAETEYFMTHFDRAKELFYFILFQIEEVNEKAKIYIQIIILLANEGDHYQAGLYGIEGLKLFNIYASSNPSQFSIFIEILKSMWLLGFKKPETLPLLPMVQDESRKIECDLISAMMMSVYVAHQNLFGFLTQKAFQLILKYGNSSFSAWAYGANSIINNTIFKRFRLGKVYGDIALSFIKEMPDTFAMQCLYGFAIHHWNYSLITGNQLFRSAFELGTQKGELMFTSNAALGLALHSIYAGESFDTVFEECTKMMAYVRRANYKMIELEMNMILQFIAALQGKTRGITELFKTQDEEDKMVDVFKGKDGILAIHWYYVLKLRLYIIYHDHVKGVPFAIEFDHTKDSSKTLFCYKEHFFLYGLMMAIRFDHSTNKHEQRLCFNQLSRARKQLKQWIKWSGVNIFHKYLLLEAEWLRLKGSYQQALTCYERAIDVAIKERFLQDAALASERAALFAIQYQQKKIAGMFLMESYYFYMKWGATTKANLLRLTYADYFSMIHQHSNEQIKDSQVIVSTKTISHTESTLLNANTLDFFTVMKSAQAISSEIRYDQLLIILMKNIVENLGAQKGFYLVETQNQEQPFQIKVRFDLDLNPMDPILVADEPLTFHQLAFSVLTHVVKQQKVLVYNESSADHRFVADSYINECHPKSILCLPVIYKSFIEGYLYLENNLITEAFSSDRIQVAQILTSQAAIAIENARLYQELVQLNQTLEQRVIDKTKDLEAAKKEAESANQFKSQFLARMSHDLRTPLHVIIGTLDMLLNHQKLVPQVAQSLDIALKSGERQLALVNDILDLSKLESGKMEVHQVAFKIKELFEGLGVMMKTLLKDKPVQFILELKISSKIKVVSDKARLLQVITNILGNASKFTQQGSITLSVEKKKMPKFQHKSRDILYFEIRDTGIGIKKEDMSKIFESYSMIDNAVQKTVQGTGLGLTICKQFIELLGGEIKFESDYGKGSCFQFWVPYLTQKDVKFVQKDKVFKKKNFAQLFKNKTILLCDDDEFNRMYVQMILGGKINFQLTDSGAKAIELIKEQHFDLVFMDIQMPIMDGRETLKAIQTFDKDTPIIALTAQAMKGDKEDLLRLGFYDYLSKPFKEEELLAFLARALTPHLR